MDMIIYTVKLLQVVEEMRASARMPGIKVEPGSQDFSLPDPTAVLGIDSKIDDLFNEMPAHLRVDADYSKLPLNEDQVKFFQSQSHALRFRLLLLRVFLLRPSLLAEAQRWATRKSGPAQTASVKFQERFHYEICNLCLDTIHKMLGEIHASLATSGGISAWYALHFTFAAATTLLVATLSPRLGVTLETEPTKSSFDRALAILEFHKSYVVSAARGIDELLRYRQSITMRTGGTLGLTPTMTQEIADVEAPPQPPYPLQAQQSQQPYPHTQSWEQPQAMPTPPMMTTWMTGVEFGVEELDHAWLTTTQDWGQQDWLLAHLRNMAGT
ncbi:hypothetical protein B0I37DRAFT_92393 [Chaetomium sp. MPI-CAGE-AT-0009]|nr:hypothetical protein B0I37DRAFT_92393 [Chaetomium sp. MPI-CAGE-AT-0009]